MRLVSYDRPADVAAELVAVERRLPGTADLQQGRLGELVVVIESRIPPVFEDLAMELVGAAPGDHVNHAAHRQALLGLELADVHPKFLDGALGEILARLALLGPGIGHAVDREAVGIEPAAAAELDI